MKNQSILEAAASILLSEKTATLGKIVNSKQVTTIMQMKPEGIQVNANANFKPISSKGDAKSMRSDKFGTFDAMIGVEEDGTVHFVWLNANAKKPSPWGAGHKPFHRFTINTNGKVVSSDDRIINYDKAVNALEGDKFYFATKAATFMADVRKRRNAQGEDPLARKQAIVDEIKKLEMEYETEGQKLINKYSDAEDEIDQEEILSDLANLAVDKSKEIMNLRKKLIRNR